MLEEHVCKLAFLPKSIRLSSIGFALVPENLISLMKKNRLADEGSGSCGYTPEISVLLQPGHSI